MNTPAAAPCSKTQCKEKDKEIEKLKKKITELEAALAAATATAQMPAPSNAPAPAPPVAPPALLAMGRARVRRCSPVDYSGCDEPATKRAKDAEKKERCYKGRKTIQTKK